MTNGSKEPKACTFGCGGTMRFDPHAEQPDSGVAVVTDDKTIYPRDFRVAAWICDQNPEHFEPVNPH